jgi:predicted ester cyclase
MAVSIGSQSSAYRGYIDCLNAQDWSKSGQFVHDDVPKSDRHETRKWPRGRAARLQHAAFQHAA